MQKMWSLNQSSDTKTLENNPKIYNRWFVYMPKKCDHVHDSIKNVKPNTTGCEECQKEHLPTVALRMCLTCGHVGCCDSSIGKHATKHFKETGHPTMVYVQENPQKWCYVHEEYI